MNAAIYSRSFHTPLGKFVLSATDKGLYSLDIVNKTDSKAKRRIPAQIDRLLRRATSQIRRYLSGRLSSFGRLGIDWSGYGRFEKKVLQELRRIPSGTSQSYQFLAQKVGRPKAARYVGRVLHLNRLPLILPCHRIIRKNGNLGGFSKGLRWKKRLLKLECERSIHIPSLEP